MVNEIKIIKSARLIVDGHIPHGNLSLPCNEFFWRAGETCKCITMPEDSLFRIEIETAILDKSNPPKVALNTFELAVVFSHAVEDSFVWRTEDAMHLQNYIGLSPVIITHAECKNVSEAFALESLATKVSARQVEGLLLFLSEKESDIVRLCFSKSLSLANSKESEWTDANLLLKVASDIVSAFSKSKPYLAHQYKSRLVPARSLVNSSDSTIDDKSIDWLIQNLDRIVPFDGINQFSISIKGKKYGISSVEKTCLVESPDVFENQVLYGLLHSVLKKLSEQLSVANTYHRENLGDSSEDYVSLSNLMIKCLPVNISWKYKCKNLIDEIIRIISFFDKYIPVSYKGEIKPKITPFVRSNQVYKQIFMLAYKWYGLGLPTWQGQEYLASLLSITKLYEIFCLLRIIDIFENKGFSVIEKSYRVFTPEGALDGCEVDQEKNIPYNCYILSNGQVEIRILFEPTIYPHWPNGRYKRIVDLSHSGVGHWRFRQPDFLISITRDRIRYEHLIIDSKYSRGSTAVNVRLPDVIQKYLLGLGFFVPGSSFIESINPLGVLVIHPDFDDVAAYASPRSIPIRRMSKNQIFSLPILLSIELSPNKQTSLVDILDVIIKIGVERISEKIA